MTFEPGSEKAVRIFQSGKTEEYSRQSKELEARQGGEIWWEHCVGEKPSIWEHGNGEESRGVLEVESVGGAQLNVAPHIQ